MNVEIWAKALTMLEAGYGAHCDNGAWIVTPWPVAWDEVIGIHAEDALAAACDALDLPWQQHPVWLLHVACEIALTCIVNGGEWEDKAMATQWLRAALDAAKGDG